MLWLCVYFPQFPLELQQPSDDGCNVASDRHGARRFIIACNDASREAGLHCGLDVTTALARVPHLKVIERNRPRERGSMKALCAWAEQFSSLVCSDPDRWLLWVEIGASLRYFGGMAALLKKVSAGLDGLGYLAMPGVAPTLEAAAILAKHAYTTPIQHTARYRKVLAELPLQLLALPSTTLEALSGIGWKKIGDVMALPRAQLARRFGPQVTHYLQRVLGEQVDLREPYRSPMTYRRRFEFNAEIETTEALIFPLRRVMGELQGYLRGRDTALQGLKLSLLHRKQHSTHIDLRTTAPQRDASALLGLLREKLDRLTLTAPVTEMTLTVDQFVPLGDTQTDLFEEKPKRDASWSACIDKFKARLGDAMVKRLGLINDRRPEKAWCIVHDGNASNIADNYPDRPLWLLTPQPLTELPPLAGSPERIEMAWGEGGDMSRDYYIAQTEEGSRWWLYRDARTKEWYLHGLWA